MKYELIIDIIRLVDTFEADITDEKADLQQFGQWLNQYLKQQEGWRADEADWEGKSTGRSADSVINTTLVHLYRYAKLQAKAAIAGTSFSTPDDFIYLINLAVHGSMTKTALIRRNVHEKSAGMQIVKRLIDNGLVEQTASGQDKRNRTLHITEKGTDLLEANMDNIRQASRNVTAPLTDQEKTELIRLLAKLEQYHEGRWRGQE